jgi:hypothetical protein
MTMAPMKKRLKRKAVRRRRCLRWKLRTDLHREQQQEVMEISSEEEEKKTETSLSSNEIRQEANKFFVKVTQKEKESTDSSDSVSDNESHPTQ